MKEKMLRSTQLDVIHSVNVHSGNFSQPFCSIGIPQPYRSNVTTAAISPIRSVFLKIFSRPTRLHRVYMSCSSKSPNIFISKNLTTDLIRAAN